MVYFFEEGVPQETSFFGVFSGKKVRLKVSMWILIVLCFEDLFFKGACF